MEIIDMAVFAAGCAMMAAYVLSWPCRRIHGAAAHLAFALFLAWGSYIWPMAFGWDWLRDIWPQASYSDHWLPRLAWNLSIGASFYHGAVGFWAIREKRRRLRAMRSSSRVADTVLQGRAG